MLIYSAIVSLDGLVADEHGRIEWAEPDEEVYAFVNELERAAGTHLYGRGMYETMAVWETVPAGPEQAPVTREFAEIWRGADKIVYSRTLASVSTARTSLERGIDVERLRHLKESAARDITVGGPNLAAQMIALDLVDEIRLFVQPVLVGGGKRALPKGTGSARLDLLEERRFGGGAVYLRYRVPARGQA